MRRHRLLYAIVWCLVVVLGLASRRYGSWLPPAIAEYSGDTLWAVMAYVAIGAIAVAWPPTRVALSTLIVSCSVEVSQLYHAPWIDAVRATRPGALALGYGFLWSDIACYTMGVVLCLAIEQVALSSSRT